MTDASEQETALGITAAVASSLRRVLTPIVRLAIARGLKFQQMSDLMKSVYVDAARDMSDGGQRPTVSRISILTGLQRRDVKQWIADDAPDPRSSMSIETQLFARWLNDPALLDEQGQPLPLPRAGAEANGITFDDVARAVTTDIHPRTILDSLLKLGIARVDDEDRVHLLSDRFVPSNEQLSMLEFFRENAHDHLAAAIGNLSGEPRMLEQSIFANGLSVDSCQQLHALSRKAWRQLSRQAVPAAQTLVDGDRGLPGGQRQRVRIGMYFYAAPEYPPKARASSQDA
ncbi:MAG TPA: DUF6502 family protein [Burkholderiaceae bacterium]|nr:DUF6502 family protein [Burkholderiaceae bacterium]